MQEQPLRRTTGAIAASGNSGNVLQGTTLQYATRPSKLRISASVPAAASGDGLMDVFAGGRQLTGRDGHTVPVEAAAGSGPTLLNPGFLLDEGVAAGELIELVFRNGDTVNAIAAPGVTYYVRIDQVA